jgi:septal ring factor EnvC (AmiA/AmiB activator)
VDEIEEQRARNAASAAAARNAALLRARQSMENARAQVLAPRFVPDERDPRTGGLAKSQRRRAINPHRRRGSSSSSSFFS